MSDDAFDEIAESLNDTVVLAFTERTDSYGIEYDLTGTEDMDRAIAIAMKGLFVMLLDSLGFWETVVDEEEEPPDD